MTLPPSLPTTGTGTRAQCIFTICTKSYIGLAETLGASLRDQGYAAEFFIVVVDHDTSDITSAVGTLLPAHDLCGFTPQEWTAQTFKYDLVEFCTSLKARVFLRLIDRGYEDVIYLDPDILVFEEISQVFDVLKTHDAVVTPHRIDIDHDIPSRGGLFNLGFFAIHNSPHTRRMLEWWDDRLTHHSISDAARGFFTDQKWMDNLPLMIPTHKLAVLDHPGMNLAPWNLHERALKHEDGRAFVRLGTGQDAWEPVVFVHYSAFNYSELSRGVFGDKAKAVCARTTGFEPLVDALIERLSKSRFADFEGIGYEFAAYSDGLPIHPGHRRIYARLEAAGQAPDNPFDAQGDFYKALGARRMLVRSVPKKYAATADDTGAVGRVVKVLDAASRLAIRLFGYDRYYLLSRFLTRYLHPVNHARLLKGKGEGLDVEYF
ncbi:MAG: hypothetical protein KDK28_17295 [Maritimibacter sp.]|nr:hypothetical protein [Maritimibacter sp.]